MGDLLHSPLLLLLLSIMTVMCLEDFAHLHVAAGRSGAGGRTPQASTRKNQDDRKAPSQDEQTIPSPQSYKSNAELLAAMKAYQSRCNKISRLYTIGKSVKGVPLLVLEISDFPGQQEPEPAFKYVGNMHGDEPSGRELLLYLAEWLCTNYLKEPKDPLAAFIVQNIHLHLLPSMNPDGFENRTRNNANDVDLNRDFPDQYYAINNKESERQAETLAIMEWVRNIPFTGSASLHEGALVASYGWDGTMTGRSGYSETPDDAGFRYMASLYSQKHPLMRTSAEFLGGITNGAAWYPLYGGMQDWNYIHGNCMEITIEMNDLKSPDISKIPEMWQQHQQSMLELVASVGKTGIHGRVMSADGNPLPAIIVVKGNDHVINASTKLGDYHRILPPGRNFELTAKFPGYLSRQTTVVLSPWKATPLDFVLESKAGTSIQVDCAEEELAYRCAAPPPLVKMKTGLRTGFGPWLPRKLVTSFDRQDLVSGVHVEHFMVISTGTVLIVVAAVLFLLVRRRRSLKGQPIRYLSRTP